VRGAKSAKRSTLKKPTHFLFGYYITPTKSRTLSLCRTSTIERTRMHTRTAEVVPCSVSVKCELDCGFVVSLATITAIRSAKELQNQVDKSSTSRSCVSLRTFNEIRIFWSPPLAPVNSAGAPPPSIWSSKLPSGFCLECSQQNPRRRELYPVYNVEE
jgi:hypothetical protein